MQDDTLRVDRWLWFTRFFKTRSAAAKAVKGGHVRINAERARTASRVRVGDTLHIVRDKLRWQITVLVIPERRGPARDARTCYEEDPESIQQRERHRESLRADLLAMPRTRGRPDKRTRRILQDRRRRGDS